MKILLMGFTNLKYMPYMRFYLDNIDIAGNEVHVLYWNRDGRAEALSSYAGITCHEFTCYQEDDVSKIRKVVSFLRYRKFAARVLRKTAYDLVIVLHTLPGVMVTDLLRKRYDKKYILDYRDSTYEENTVFRAVIHALARHARLTFVSSDAFRRYLPSELAIVTSHNILRDSLNHRDEKEQRGTPSDRIRIAFWGMIRHLDVNRAIIEKVGRDSRFELHYYGREQAVAQELKRYTRELGIGNVFFHGEYQAEDRYEFACHTDLLHNIYHDRNTMLAMGNKYYDGIVFRIPQLCMRGSFMGISAQRAGVGISCDPYSDSFMRDIFDYRAGIDAGAFKTSCDTELARILKDVEDGGRLIHESTNTTV